MNKDPLFELAGIKLMVVVAGLLGGIIQLSLNPKLSVPGAVTSVVAGVSCAAFVTPVMHFWAAPPQVENAVAFFLGLLGMHITAKIYEWFSTIKPSQFVGSLLSFFYKRNENKYNDKH